MTAITGLRRRRVDLASCWSSTGCHHARSTAPCGHQRKPATATLSDRPNHQSQLLLPACRVIARAAGASRSFAHTFRVSQIPIAEARGAFRAPSPAGSFLGGFRTPATVYLAPSIMAGIRNPAQVRKSTRTQLSTRSSLRHWKRSLREEGLNRVGNSVRKLLVHRELARGKRCSADVRQRGKSLHLGLRPRRCSSPVEHQDWICDALRQRQ